jgi:hypothetical protein
LFELVSLDIKLPVNKELLVVIVVSIVIFEGVGSKADVEVICAYCVVTLFTPMSAVVAVILDKAVSVTVAYIVSYFVDVLAGVVELEGRFNIILDVTNFTSD